MGKNYVSVRVKAVSSTEAKHQTNHDTRSKCPGYVEEPDTTTYLFSNDSAELIAVKNDEATAGIKKLLDVAVADQEKKYKEKFKKKRHAGAKPFIEGIITFSDPDVTGTEQLTQAAEKYVRAFCAEHGANPFYLSRHDDEAKTHFHFVIENQRADGYSVRKKMDRAYLRHLQDLAAETFSPLGFERGEKIDIPRRYLSVREMRREEIKKFVAEEKNLREQIQDAQGVLAGLEASTIALEEQLSQGIKEMGELKAEIKKRREEKEAWKKQIQATVADGEARKEEYRKYEAETKRQKEELKRRKEEIFKTEDYLNELKVLLKSQQRPDAEKIKREELTRDVLGFLVAASRLPETAKQALENNGFGTRWPSSIPIQALEKTAGEMSQLLEKSGQKIQR